jgi:hypothetical protein
VLALEDQRDLDADLLEQLRLIDVHRPHADRSDFAGARDVAFRHGAQQVVAGARGLRIATAAPASPVEIANELRGLGHEPADAARRADVEMTPRTAGSRGRAARPAADPCGVTANPNRRPRRRGMIMPRIGDHADARRRSLGRLRPSPSRTRPGDNPNASQPKSTRSHHA